MSSATYKEAVREIQTVFKDAWGALGYGTAANNQNAEYEGVPRPGADKTAGQPWARSMIRHLTGTPATLTGAAGTVVYRRTGFVMVEIYNPVGTGHDYDSVQAVVDAFEGQSTASQVYFRNVRVNEVGLDGNFVHTNVVADFEYDEVK